MKQSAHPQWPDNRLIVDRRSGLTTILMMLVSVQGVVVAATMANHHWSAAAIECALFLLPDGWLIRKAYGLGIGIRRDELGSQHGWSPRLQTAVAGQLEQIENATDRDWLTRAELRQLRQHSRAR